MNKVHYSLLGISFLITGIVLAVLGLKFNINNDTDKVSDGDVAMMVIGFILIVFSFIFFIVGYRKTENEKMIL
jgi:hypothetical protein